MATKVIYFSIGGHDEQAEFSADDTTENVKGAALEFFDALVCYFSCTADD
jgi:hypothetical protein